MKDILERTSVRAYTNQEISKEDIEKILRAGFSAPSAHDYRPWEFIVVQNKETLEKMSTVSHYSTMMKDAGFGLVVLVDMRQEGLDIEHGIMDTAAATENMLIAAKKLGIGSCWIGGYPKQDRLDKLRELFDIPEYCTPMWMVAFGYPETWPPVKDKWDESKIHYETY